jgi:hypothetical protein
VHDFFEGREEVDDVLPISNIREMTSMTLRRFELLTQHLRLSAVGDGRDPWWPVRAAVQAFNEVRQRVLVPGRVLCIDECMCGWRGKNGKWYKDGLPAVSMIARKPVGIGLGWCLDCHMVFRFTLHLYSCFTEFKSTADCETGMLLRLELAEGKEAMKNKKYCDTYKPTTACSLRLTEPWFGTRRIVVGDSGFASVPTAVALREQGMFFTGAVKTAYASSPKVACLEILQDAQKGSCVWYTAKVRDTPLLFLGWKDKTSKSFVTTIGNSSLGNPHVRWYNKLIDGGEQEVEVRIPRPAVVEKYFSNANAIDVHDHYRQGGLALERSWRTHTWWHRVFATLLGMCETDAYLAFYHFGGHEVEHSRFTRALAAQLIDCGKRGAVAPVLRKRLASELGGAELVGEDWEGHMPVALPRTVKRPKDGAAAVGEAARTSATRITCAIDGCGGRTTFRCLGCGSAEQPVGYCVTKTSGCHVRHVVERATAAKNAI